jgi:hypothetical protein
MKLGPEMVDYSAAADSRRSIEPGPRFITSEVNEGLAKLTPELAAGVSDLVRRKEMAAAHERPIIPPGVHMPEGRGKYGAPAERRILYAPPPPKG